MLKIVKVLDKNS